MNRSPFASAALLVSLSLSSSGCGGRSALGSEDPGSSSGTPGDGGSSGSTGAEDCFDFGPVQIASSPGTGPVVADESFVYWVVEDGIWRTTPDGAHSTELVTGEPMPFAIALDDDHVYWTATPDGGSHTHLSRAPKHGGKSDVLWKAGFETAAGVAVDATDVYWISRFGWSEDDDRCDILAMPKGGGEERVVARNQSGPASLALDDHRVYWLNEGRMDDYGAGDVRSAAKAGGDVVTLATHQGSWGGNVDQTPNGIATDGVDVAWVLREGTVRAVATSGGAVRTIAFGQDVPRSLVLDGGDVYWPNSPNDGSEGSLMRMRTHGGTARALAGDLRQPWHVATSGPFVFWTDDAGEGQVGSLFRSCR